MTSSDITPETRLAEAEKQVRIARESLGMESAVAGDLEQVAADLRDAIDRLDEVRSGDER